MMITSNFLALALGLFLTSSTPAQRVEQIVQQPIYSAQISNIPGHVRMLMMVRLWHPSCPVSLDDLAYLQLSYWGYDNQPRQGVIIVNKKVANEIVAIFKILFDNRFPIENMSPTYSPVPELALPNNTESFNCRSIRGLHDLSLHSYGLAIDINPLVNPEVRGKLVIPPEGRAFLDRNNVRKGMIVAGDIVTQAFAMNQWQWGGNWTYPIDYMHFEKKQLLPPHAK